MVTMTRTPVAAEGGSVVLYDVSWELYERLLEELGDQHVYLTYDEGSLEIMSPLPRHEVYKKVIAAFIEILTLELNVPVSMLGSTTFKRRDLGKGLEPDECYYVQNEPKIRGKDVIDLSVDPPPDLVVEVDITHRPLERQPIYRAMGVKEIWRFDGLTLTFLALGQDGDYHAASRSVAFPSLEAVSLQQFLSMLPATDHTSLRRSFQNWVRENLKP